MTTAAPSHAIHARGSLWLLTILEANFFLGTLQVYFLIYQDLKRSPLPSQGQQEAGNREGEIRPRHRQRQVRPAEVELSTASNVILTSHEGLPPAYAQERSCKDPLIDTKRWGKVS